MGWFGKKKEKKKADFSNVLSGGSSTASPSSPSTAPTSPRATAEDEVYVVQKGDSLWKIAERFYGRGNDWKRIFDESSQTISPSARAATEFHVSKPDGWPEGDYRVEILLNGESAGSKEFKIESPS